MISDNERAPAKVLAGPGQRGRLSRSWSTAAARAESLPDRRRAGTTHGWAVPVADTAGLAAASVASGLSGGAPGIALRAGYGAVVLIILAGTGRHGLRIRLRVSDKAGRVLIATIVPVLAVLAWLPAHRALSLAVWSGGLVLCCRGLLYAALRAAHRRGLLTEPAVVVEARHVRRVCRRADARAPRARPASGGPARWRAAAPGPAGAVPGRPG